MMPVIHDESSDARNSAVWTTSSGVPESCADELPSDAAIAPRWHYVILIHPEAS
jgi:hypothetical protein